LLPDIRIGLPVTMMNCLSMKSGFAGHDFNFLLGSAARKSLCSVAAIFISIPLIQP
jgi:hypothetical protein